MSNQFGTGANPPWARQDYTSQAVTGILQTNISYPYSQTQQPYAPQTLAAGASLQSSQAAYLTPAGLALPTALTAPTGQVGAISYPMKAQNATTAIASHQQRIFTGTVTNMHDNFGFVDDEVFFQISCVNGVVPKVGDRVLIEAVYNANMPFNWSATRVVSLSETVATAQMTLTQQQQQQQQQLKTIQQQQAMGVVGAPGILSNLSSMTAGQGLATPPVPPPVLPGLGKFPTGSTTGMLHAAGFSRINTGPGVVPDPVPRSTFKDMKSVSLASQTGHDSQKEKERRDRDNRDRRERRRKRSRSPVRKLSRSPPTRSATTPPKRKPVVQIPRYVVQVPKVLLDVQDSCVMALKSKYSNLYIPSDFFHATFSWVDNFPMTHPLVLGQASSFQIMHKDVPPPPLAPPSASSPVATAAAVKQEVADYEPDDADFLFSAKVMLLASPSEQELYKKSCCLAEDMPGCMDTFQHPTRLLQFLVGTRSKNEPMAIGGPWSPSLDGPNPQSNPHVLIKTAIRTTKALTGIDLSACTHWYRFAEIRYFRAEIKSKERVQAARVETVIIFLPDVWTCKPTLLEWVSIQAVYQNQLQQILNPVQQQEEEEVEDQQMETRTEPSHYSTLDPKVMKIGEMRRELELRNLSPKGLKSQLIARLTKALKIEQKKQEAKDMETYVDAEQAPAKEEEEESKNGDDDDDQDTDLDSKRKEDDEQERKEKRQRAVLEWRYQLSESPCVLVHPSPTAKSGKFDCCLMSLSLLLDYRPEDNKEHSFEVSLFAELFNEMLMRDFGFEIYKSVVNATARADSESKQAQDRDDRRGKDEDKRGKDEDKRGKDEDKRCKDEDMRGKDEDKRGKDDDRRSKDEDKRGKDEDKKGKDEDKRGKDEDKRGKDDDRRSKDEDKRGKDEDKRGKDDDRRSKDEDKRGKDEDKKGKDEDKRGNDEDKRGNVEDKRDKDDKRGTDDKRGKDDDKRDTDEDKRGKDDKRRKDDKRGKDDDKRGKNDDSRDKDDDSRDKNDDNRDKDDDKRDDDDKRGKDREMEKETSKDKDKEDKVNEPCSEQSEDKEPSPKRKKSNEKEMSPDTRRWSSDKETSPKRKSAKEAVHTKERADLEEVPMEQTLNDDSENKEEESRQDKGEEESRRDKGEEESRRDKGEEESRRDKGEEESRRDKGEKKRKKHEEKPKKKTVNPRLLLACSYFDQNHCGYLADKDLEDIIHTLGLKLSRAQIRKIMQKVLHRDTFQYRKFTDQEVSADGVSDKPGPEEGSVHKLDATQLARGNKESLRKLLELSKVKIETSAGPPISDNNGGSSSSGGSIPSVLYYRGAVVDIESLMQRLEKSQKSRTALEKRYEDLADEMKQLKTQLTQQENTNSRLQQDLIKAQSALDQERTLSTSAQSMSTEWQKALLNSKYHVTAALSSLNSVLAKEVKKTQDENHMSHNEEHGKCDKTQEAEGAESVTEKLV